MTEVIRCSMNTVCKVRGGSPKYVLCVDGNDIASFRIDADGVVTSDNCAIEKCEDSDHILLFGHVTRKDILDWYVDISDRPKLVRVVGIPTRDEVSIVISNNGVVSEQVAMVDSCSLHLNMLEDSTIVFKLPVSASKVILCCGMPVTTAVLDDAIIEGIIHTTTQREAVTTLSKISLELSMQL